MYCCEDCGAVFAEPAFVPGRNMCPDEWVCPVCGQTWDAEEAQMCNLCGEYHHPNDMASEHCCKACAEANMTLPVMKRYIAGTEQRKEFYVEFMTGGSVVTYATDELMDTEEREFDKTPEADKVKYLRDFISDDEADFAAWLEDADNV